MNTNMNSARRMQIEYTLNVTTVSQQWFKNEWDCIVSFEAKGVEIFKTARSKSKYSHWLTSEPKVNTLHQFTNNKAHHEYMPEWSWTYTLIWLHSESQTWRTGENQFPPSMALPTCMLASLRVFKEIIEQHPACALCPFVLPYVSSVCCNCEDGFLKHWFEASSADIQPSSTLLRCPGLIWTPPSAHKRRGGISFLVPDLWRWHGLQWSPT